MAAALAAMIAIAAALWGMVFPTQIHDQFEPQPAVLTAVRASDGTHCDIFIWSHRFYEVSQEERQRYVNHEYGHCLGLNHIDHPGIMSFNASGEFSGWDRLEFWHHYPAPYRIIVPF